jgi:hypothetical protein
MIDLLQYPPIEWERFRWLLKAGVPVDTLTALTPIRIATGRRAEDGIFEDDDAGAGFLVFEEPEDVIFWQPRTGEIATAVNRAFALGENAIYNPGTYSFDCHLNIFSSPLDWLRNRCDGCVILHWDRAFDRLLDAPRIAISEDLLFLYKRHMRPSHMPEVSVIATGKAVAA